MPVATPPVIHKSASHSTDLCQDGRVVPQPKRKNSKPGARDGVLAGRTGRTFAGDLLGSCGSSRSEPDHFRKKNIYIYHIRVFFKSFGSRNPAPSNTTGKLWQEESVWLGLRRAGEFLEKSSVRQTRFFTILAFDRSGAWSS